jgi:hypothetical protein
MTEYTSYVNPGKKPLWECIMIWYPHVDEANAKRIAEEALETPMSMPLKNHQQERRWRIVKLISFEAKRLKRDQEGA